MLQTDLSTFFKEHGELVTKAWLFCRHFLKKKKEMKQLTVFVASDNI